MPKNIPAVSKTLFDKLTKLKERDGFGNKSFEDWFHYITRDVSLARDVIAETTMHDFLPMWLRNFAENLPYIRYGNDTEVCKGSKRQSIEDLAEPMPEIIKSPPKGSGIVIGRGPDVFTHKHIEVLAGAVHSGRYKGFIGASDGMLIECLKNDLVPDITLSVDGSPIITKWYDHPLVEKYGAQLKVILMLSVHNSVFQVLRKNRVQIYWVVPLFDNFTKDTSYTKMHRLMTTTEINLKPISAMTAGGCAGNALWAAVADLFKRSPIGLIGYTCGYPEGYNIEKTSYFSTAVEECKKVNVNPASIISSFTKEYYHPYFKCKAYTDGVFETYRESFLQMQTQTYPWYDFYGGTWNLTEGGVLFGPKIKCATLEEFLCKFKT